MAKLLKEKYGLDPEPAHSNELQVQMMRIDQLVLPNRRMRRHSSKAAKKIRASVHTFGIIRPLLVDQSRLVIDGHAVIEAAKELGYQEIPVIVVRGMNAARIKALSMALNRTQELGEWNFDVVKDTCNFIIEFDPNFDLTETAFETAELDMLLKQDDDEEDTHHPDPADRLPEDDVSQVVSVPGDLFKLGDHVLLCGDATKAEDLALLMNDENADMGFTDHPFNLASRSIGGLGKVQMAAGEMSVEEFEEFLRITIQLIIDNSREGAVLYFCIDWRSVELMLKVGRELGLKLLNICVWTKDNGGMGSFYRSKHEMICVLRKGDRPHINNVELGKHGRYRTNHWEYTGFNSFSKERNDLLSKHPTVKPVALVSDAIKDASHRNDVILDPFGGSGTTIIAAQKSGRKARCIEIHPKYVDTIIRRFEEQFEIEAVHVETGLGFSTLAKQRLDDPDAIDAAEDQEPRCRVRTRKSFTSKGDA